MPSNHDRAARLLAAALLIAAAACSDQMLPTGPESEPVLSVEAQRPVLSHWTIDDEFDRIAREEMPGFGGFFFDEDLNPVIYLVDATQQAAASRLADQIQADLDTPKRTLILRNADYDFTQLMKWHDELLPIVERDDVFWLDIDETVNKLRIGVENRTAVASVRADIEDGEIPYGAVIVEVSPRIERRLTLQEWVRPVDGGFQIQNLGGGTCTLGFNALHDGQQVFVTASHCSQIPFSNPDNYPEFQPYVDPGQTQYIGREVDDRPYYNCDWPVPNCRWSDAAAFLYEGVEVERGYIARTESRTQGQDGTLLVDASEPRLEVHGKATTHYVGWYVDKVGRTSGWTTGPITQSCVTLGNLRCQMVAQLWSRPGDSGSPIFRITRHHFPYDYVLLYGVLWGGPVGDWTTTWYSPISGVEADLGAFHPDPAPANPPLNASIVGPTQVQPGEYCTWWSNVQGGDSPYDYEWSGVLSGTQPWVSGSLYNSGLLVLDVWDSASPPAHDSDALYVEVTWDAPPCYEDR